MTLLCIAPDYFSHYVPLAAAASRWRLAGEDVVFATGPSLRDRVRRDGFSYTEFILAPRSNPGLLQPRSLDDSELQRLQSNLEATRMGMVETLRYQAETRLCDLLWEPGQVLERLQAILRDVQPDHVLSVQLAYNATAALLALEVPFASFVTGHPAQVPGPGELYGFPHVRPHRFMAPRADLDALARLCRDVQDAFTTEFNHFIASADRKARPVTNGLAASSPWLVLHNYPGEIGEYRRDMLPPQARFVGAVIRDEELDSEASRWIETGDRAAPVVLVSFGSFFSLRTDVLQRVADALRRGPFRVLMATGAAGAETLGLPADWYAGPYLPQAALLKHCDLVITHGGNNTVLEALSAGVPLLVGPFSSDQFAGAADIERCGLGAVFDPNESTPDEIRSLAERSLAARPGARAIGRRLRLLVGADVVRAQMTSTFGREA